MISYSLEYTDDLANSILDPTLELPLKREEPALTKGIFVRLWQWLSKVIGFRSNVLQATPFLYLSIPGMVNANLASARINHNDFDDDDDVNADYSFNGLFYNCVPFSSEYYDIGADPLELYE